jgi:hypothetical protein
VGAKGVKWSVFGGIFLRDLKKKSKFQLSKNPPRRYTKTAPLSPFCPHFTPNPPNAIERHRTPSNAMERHGTPMEHRWNAMEHRWNAMEHRWNQEQKAFMENRASVRRVINLTVNQLSKNGLKENYYIYV